MTRQVFLASRNIKKLSELRRILADFVTGIEVLGLDDVGSYEEPVEDRASFADNALLKARAGATASGLPTLADDSGLCVDALNGMPGVLSARWSGDLATGDRDLLNNCLLLGQLAQVPEERRGAHFACAIAYCEPDGFTMVEHGRMPGRVIRERRGEGGFGYDVLFVPAEHAATGQTSAEISAEAKDAISHRGRALRAIAPRIAERWAGDNAAP